MNFRKVVYFLTHEDRVTKTVVSPDDSILLSSLEALIGKAYRFTRAYDGKTPEEAMRLILWMLFYFVQQERELTDKDEDVVLEALAAAKANAAFCRKDVGSSGE